MARWIVITGLLAMTGLIYVYLTIQLSHQGDQKRALEKSLVDLGLQNEMAKAQIATLTSRSALQHRLKEGYLKMSAIKEENIIRLGPPRAADDAIQPVSNQRNGR